MKEFAIAVTDLMFHSFPFFTQHSAGYGTISYRSHVLREEGFKKFWLKIIGSIVGIKMGPSGF